MAKVIERQFDLNYKFTDICVNWKKADKLAGKRLDRRRNYAIIDGNFHTYVEWTAPCTGCSCEYPCMCCHEKGQGCFECGGTGKRRSGMWSPFKLTPSH